MAFEPKRLADGQLGTGEADLYNNTGSATVIISKITITNTDTSARTVDIYIKPSGGTSREIWPKACSLGVSYHATDTRRHVLHTGDALRGKGSAASKLDYIIESGDPSTMTSGEFRVFDASGQLSQSVAVSTHATSHKAGGGDDLLGAPGAIGGATPAAGTFTDLTAGGDVNITLGAAENVTIDAETNPRTIGDGTIHIDHKPSIIGTRCFTLDIDANSIADTLAVAVEYLATAMATGEVGIGIDVTVDTIDASGGEVQALVVSKVGTGTLEVDAIHAGPGVLPIRQESGAFGAADNVEKTTDESAFTAITTASEMFSADNDFVYLGHSTTFNEVEWLFNTVASGAGIKPEFYFSTGAGTWALFGPNDSTNGCRTNGVLEWELADISGTWALATYDAVSKYWIKIKRTAANLTTKPVLNTMKLVSATMYSWDDSGDLTINDLTYGGTLYVFDAGGETITGDGTDLTISSGNDINLTATTDINVPANVGVTFGNDAEKIEGDGTDLTISGNIINLSPTADVAIPADKGLLFAGTEKIESDGTDLTLTVGATGDINIGADIGLTFGDDGEKIEGNGTDLTIASSNLLNLTATTDIIIPVNVGLKFGDGGEHIETDNTDFTITSGGELNLTAASDVVIPVNVGLHFGDGAEKIESNNTDLTINSGGELNLTAASDVVIPVNIGLHLGDGAEKLESNNTDLTVNSGGDIDLTATSNVNIPSGVGVTFGDDGEVISGDGTDLTITSSGVLNLTGTTVSLNDKVITALKGLLLTAATELTLDTNGAITATQMVHTVDTFENAASDNLVTINGGTTVGVLFLRPAHTDRSIVLDTGAGNIVLQGGADITLDDITDHIMLFWDTTNSKWVDFGGGGGAAGANTALSNLASVAINTTLVSDGDNTDDLGSDAVRWKDLYLSGKIECLGGIWDDDADTGIQVEESADEDIIRMDVGGAGGDNVFLMSAAGIQTLAKQSTFRCHQSVDMDAASTNRNIGVYGDAEDWDIQNEYTLGEKTGAADATAANKLHDADGGFAASDVGATIWNTTDDTGTDVSGFVDTGELDLTHDIMADTENYKLYNGKFTVTEAGKYIAICCIAYKANIVADQVYDARFLKNGALDSFARLHSALATRGSNVFVSAPLDCAAADYIQCIGYHTAGSTMTFQTTYTFWAAYKYA